MVKKIKSILVINGPNLNLLGKREPGVYGSNTLEEINKSIRKKAEEKGVEIEFFQSNHEGDIVDKIGSATADALIINPAAFTHTSVAIRDALAVFSGPKIEVHLSNIFKREDFRRNSVTVSETDGMISGFGGHSYILALNAILKN